MAGELNIPFEPTPDGPFELDVAMIQCGGVHVTVARTALPDGTVFPVLIFDFFTVAGERVPPIALYVTVDEMRHVRDNLNIAIDAALGAVS